jgi:hypothetical protein
MVSLLTKRASGIALQPLQDCETKGCKLFVVGNLTASAQSRLFGFWVDYATLELEYGCSRAAVQEAFDRLARNVNPTGNITDSRTGIHSSRSSCCIVHFFAATRFQQLMTAFEVLFDEKARAGYDRVLQLRYFLQQTFDTSNPLCPYMIFSLHKINENKIDQPRLLQVDSADECLG